MLVNICSVVVDLKEQMQEAFILSQYAIVKRYPGEYRRLTKEDAEKAVVLAEEVREQIISLLNIGRRMGSWPNISQLHLKISGEGLLQT